MFSIQRLNKRKQQQHEIDKTEKLISFCRSMTKSKLLLIIKELSPLFSLMALFTIFIHEEALQRMYGAHLELFCLCTRTKDPDTSDG